jgi:FAD/FMN-containing dehydrogenase
MHLVTPKDPRYDDRRALYNAMIDRRPAVIAECAGPEDVVDALAYARGRRLDVAVRAGGHSVAGASTNDGGLVVDVRPMNGIMVDPARRTVRAGAGLTWGEFDRATQEHGLATTGGRISSTGVAGLTLGGGSGWLERLYGLACDGLLSVDLVTADGWQVTATRDKNAELFWALHGGGGNFGVVTSLEFQLHPVGPTVLAGLAAWTPDGGADLARWYRDYAERAPAGLGTAFGYLAGPPEEFIPEHMRGETIAAIIGMWAGEPDEGRDLIGEIQAQGPAVDLFGEMPYADFQCMIDDPPGFRHYWTADYHDAFDDGAVDTFVSYGVGRPELCQQLLIPWGGAVAERAAETPMAQRGASWVSHPFAMWERAEDDDRCIEWARGFHRDIAPKATGGVYLNFIGDEGADRVRAAFGAASYARLTAVKAEYDPDNVFRGNQNIPPAGADPVIDVPAARDPAEKPADYAGGR